MAIKLGEDEKVAFALALEGAVQGSAELKPTLNFLLLLLLAVE